MAKGGVGGAFGIAASAGAAPGTVQTAVNPTATSENEDAVSTAVGEGRAVLVPSPTLPLALRPCKNTMKHQWALVKMCE